MSVLLRPRNFLFALIVAGLMTAGVVRAELSPAWLLLSADGEDSVMTVGANEKEILVKAGWTVEAEGSVQAEVVDGAALLHRMIRSNPQGTTRMLESDPAEVAKLKAAGFVEEGLLGFVIGTGGDNRLPIVQFSREGKRLWLSKEASQKAAEAKGWKRQGIQFWIWPAK